MQFTHAAGQNRYLSASSSQNITVTLVCMCLEHFKPLETAIPYDNISIVFTMRIYTDVGQTEILSYTKLGDSLQSRLLHFDMYRNHLYHEIYF